MSIQPSGRVGFVAVLSCAFGASMLAYRPTVMQTIPTMVQDLGFTAEEGGALLSLGATVYMFCKPAMQVVSDSVEARTMLVLSVTLSGILFLGIGLSSAMWQIQLSFAMVHVTQAMHSPAMLSLVGRQFTPKERGTPTSIINSSGNAVNALIPLLVTSTLRWTRGSWRIVFLSQGGCCAVVGVLLAPAILRFKPPPPPPLKAAQTVARHAATPAVTMAGVARNGSIWLLGLCSTALYVVRFGVEGWLASYFAEGSTKEAGAGAAAVFLFWWQTGGFVGSLAAGPFSDRHLGGARTPLMVIGAMVLVTCLIALPRLGGAGAAMWALAACGAVCGACVFGQRTLIILCTRAQVPPNAGGKADAIVNLLAELGGVLAGLPLIRLINRFSWHTYTPALNCAALTMVVCGLLLYGKEKRVTVKT
eukprot:g762.t1